MHISSRLLVLSAAMSLFLVGLAPAACPQGDVNGDCRVDFEDVRFFAERWLDPAPSPADLTGSNGVDWADYSLVAADWGQAGDVTGSLRITIVPAEVIADGAQWRIAGDEWRDSGELVEDIPAGVVTVEFIDVPGWDKPADEEIQIVAGQLTSTTRTYVHQTSSLRVDILPAEAVAAGAQWRADDGPWTDSGQTLGGLAVGSHIITFKNIPGWVTPPERTAMVNQDLTTIISATYSKPVVISEFMASNKSKLPLEDGELLDEDGKSSDWIELYNPTDITIDLSGWYLTDTDANLAKWRIPQGVELEAGEFLVVFASGKDRRDPALPLHTNFKLDADAGRRYLALVAPDGFSVVHEYAPRYPDQLSNISYGMAHGATKLIEAGATAAYHVPTAADAGKDWTAINFSEPWDTGKTGLNYEYFHGDWSVLPNFDALTPEAQGVADGFDISLRTRNDYFGFRFTGSIEIPTAGNYTFYTTSDDGSQLFIGDTLVVNNDGLHGMREVPGSINLAARMYPITVTFFEKSGGEGLIVNYSGPGISKREIPASALWVGPKTDVQARMQNVNASLWTRFEFYLEAGQAETFDTLTLRMKYEDGFVAYLNGRRVASENAPRTTSWNSAALSDRPMAESQAFTSFNLMPYVDALVAGKNVLAIQALNDSASDGEFLVLPELVASSESGIYQYFTTPTPGTFNVAGARGRAGEVWFSHERGFYDSPFNVTLSTGTNGAEIRYTTDGSTPSAMNGIVYTAPIRIDSTTPLRAVAVKPGYLDSEVVTHTYFFLSDIKTQSPYGTPPPGWPAGPVNGQVLDYGMDPDIVNSPTWGPKMDEALLSIPSISLVTDLSNLLDPATGIYVNPGGEGRSWERPTSVELINPDGSDGFHINAGLRIRGGYSRGKWNPKHAFRLFFRSEYGEANLRFPLFGDEGADEFDKVDLRTSQNYSWSHGGSGYNTMVRDVFSRDIQGAMGHPYTRSRYYHLYINGIYWGLFQTQERSDSAFAESYMGPEREDYDVIKTHGMYASDGNRDAIDRLYDETMLILNNNDIERYYRIQGLNPDGTPNPNYERLLDVHNIIDFMIIEYYTGDRDGPASRYTTRPNNTYAIYNRVHPDGFKWLHHDNEHTLGAGSAELNMVEPFTTAGAQRQHFNVHWQHQELANVNIDYRLHFADHVYKHFFNGGLLTAEKAREYIQMRADQIDMAIIAESARWGDAKRSTPFTKQDWLNEIDRLLYDSSDKRLITDRVPTVISQFRNVGWYPSIEPPAWSQHGGEVPKGYSLTMSTPSGTIYYTLDGTDPRLTTTQSGSGGVVVLVREVAPKKVLVPTGPAVSTTGSILYEYYMGIGGNSVAELRSDPKYPDSPDGSDNLTLFEAPVDWAESFGARIRGYVHPPTTRDYTFWISSDDNSELWLSSDENPANVTRIAFESSWTGSRVWENGNERSGPIRLEAGRKYYVEALMKEGTGGDNLAVRWDGPGYPNPIPGTYLSPPALPDTWTKLFYDDSRPGSGWRSGTGGVGYEASPDDATNYTDLIGIDVLDEMRGKNTTCYIRIPFTVATLDVKQLTLKVKYDDGFVAYINGGEVARRNFTGSPDWNSSAGTSHSDSAARLFEAIDITEHIGKLKIGQNILAIQGLNVSLGSSDFLISAELTSSQIGQGDPSPNAIQYAGPVTLDKSALVKARVFNGAWSPLREAAFAVGPLVESLRITEIMYHPAETGDPEDPNKEFIELTNIGPETVNLNQVRFTKGIDFTFGDIDLAPGQYVLVVAKRSAFDAQYPGYSGIIAGEYDGRLANDGERIRLEDAIGRTILDFNYKDGWRRNTDGGGFSLTIIDPAGMVGQRPEQGLVAHWKFDDGAGTTATDSAGTNHGTLHGNPTWTSGYDGGALAFDGIDDYVSIAGVPALAGNNVTVEAWVKMGNIGQRMNPVLMQHHRPPTNEGYYFYVYDNRPAFYVVSGGTFVHATSPDPLGADEWHHIAGTNDGSSIRMYIDGQLKAAGSSTGLTGADHDAYIGYSAVAPTYYIGSIDDVRVYDRALGEYELPGQVDPSEHWDDGDSWRASAFQGGSPGQDDSGIIPNPGDIVINEVLAHSHGVAADWIELYNTTDADIEIGGWYLSDSDVNLMKYRIAEGTEIPAKGYVVFYEDLNFGESSADPGRLVGFALSENGEQVVLSSGQAGVLTGYRAVEDFGASATGVSFGRYFKRSTGNYNFVAMDHPTPGQPNAYPKVGPIIISEIMYNPASGDQKLEYIELRNIGSAPVTLYDFFEALPWKFTDGIDYTFPDYPGATLQPGEYLLLAKDPSAFVSTYGDPPFGVLLLGPYDGWLNNNGEKLELSMPGDLDEFGIRHYIRLERVNYSDGSHPQGEPGGVDLWPSEPDGGGKSLGRITPGAYANDPNNWTAAEPWPN